ncbi:MAG: alpha/beta hydrolase [Victivallaceae bacterium]|nr:alpha/beta hydrolase [Victivallaceae bacterium]
MIPKRFSGLVLIHGGPGAPGSMDDLASMLPGAAAPRQTKYSIAELTAELAGQFDGAKVLLGHSWGAWLAVLFTAAHPEKVKSLILVGTPPLDERFVPLIAAARAAKAGPRFNELLKAIDKNPQLLSELGKMCEASDNYSPIAPAPSIAVNGAMYDAVWNEAAKLRASGEISAAFAALTRPVAFIHGADDPHPFSGVAGSVPAARLFLLGRCGHSPWREKFARNRFQKILEELV